MKRAVSCFIALILCMAATSLRADNLPLGKVDFNSVAPGLTLTAVGSYFNAVNGTNVDVVGPGNPNVYGIVTAVNLVDLGGTGGNSLGQLEATFDTTAGTTYYLGFVLGGSQRPEYTSSTETYIKFGTAPLMDLTLAANAPMQEYFVSFVGDGNPAFLDFTLHATENPNVGSLLQSVDLETSPIPLTTTPEPTSLLLLGSGLAALAGYTRRRFGKSN